MGTEHIPGSRRPHTIHPSPQGGRQATEEMSTVTLLASVGVHCRQGSFWKARLRMLCQFTVGLRMQGKADRIVVDAEDALVAALKVKAERPEVAIMYVRRLNRRGDTRHPPHTLTGGRNQNRSVPG